MNPGLWLAITGAAIAAFMAGSGSAIGIGLTGRAASAVLAEDPDRFGSLFILVALPGTQGFYGFIAALLVILKVGLLGTPLHLSTLQGLEILGASLPMGFTGLISAIHQGRVCASSIQASSKRPEITMKGVIYGAMVETYAVLGLLTTLFLLLGIKLG